MERDAKIDAKGVSVETYNGTVTLSGSVRSWAEHDAALDPCGWTVQLCGDAHLSNVGLFGTPERRLAFDLNDFDETDSGPWEWDVKRLATSVVVAGRERGFSAARRREAVVATVSSYRTAMREFAAMGALEVWY